MRLPMAFLSLALAAAALAQEPSGSLSLADAARLALGQATPVRAAEARLDQAEARLSAARSTWLPSIRLSQGWTSSDNPVFVFGSLLEQGRFGAEHFDPAFLNDPDPLDNWRLELNVRYPLFDQFRRLGSIRQAGFGASAARLQSDAVRQQSLFETLRLYDGVGLATARVELAGEALAAAESETVSIRDRFETGLLVESELMAAEVQAADYRQQQIAAEGELDIARTALASYLGLDILPALTTPMRPVSAPMPDLEPLLEAARARADVESADLMRRIASVDVQKAKGSWLPRVDGFASAGASGEEFGETDSDRTFGVVVSLDLLQPGRLAELARARAAEKEAEANRDAATRAAALEVRSAWRRLAVARERLEVATRSATRAEEALRIVRDRYETGLTTITEQLRAETAWYAAKLQLLSATADVRLGLAGLLRAAGQLESIDMFSEEGS